MIDHIITFSIRNKGIIGVLTVLLIIGGVASMLQVPIDAVPDITNNQVQVITVAPNLGTEDIEQFITYPIEVAMANLPGVLEIRSVSRFGLSVVTIVFEDGKGAYLPRQLVSEKLVDVRQEIPKGMGDPFIGPITTGLGEIYQYTLEVDSAQAGRYTPMELRTIQDWIVRRQMAMVPGVIEVNAFGGYVKQYEVSVDPERLRSAGVTIADLFAALEKNNQNTGGAYIEKNHEANFIRGEGLIRTVHDIEQTLVHNENGVPLRIADLADVRMGSAVRYGAFTGDGKGEAVGGMILMLKGENPAAVIDAVKERIARIQHSLPEGVRIVPFLDRSELIRRTTSTVTTNLLEGGLIVIFVLVFLLGNWRGGLLVASTIPLSLLFAFILMYIFDVWANLMSLGAIDFGIIVDGAVIIVESTVFAIQKRIRAGSAETAVLRDEVAASSSKTMMRSAFFGQLIILIVFIPILVLGGVEGKMFIPMAQTFMFAMLGAIILCLTYVPMMSAYFLRAGHTTKPGLGDRIVGKIESVYVRTLRCALRSGRVVIGAAVLLLAIAGYLFAQMGAEFIPQLDEGDIAFHAILKPGSSLTEAIESTTHIESILLENFPEVEHAFSRIGVADVPTDPMPMDIADVFVILKPRDAWTSATSKEELITKMKRKVSVLPGINFEFTQPIEMRFNELLTGVREDIAVKLYGDDIDILAVKAEEIGKIVAPIQGVADMRVEATKGLPQMTVRYNRRKLSQYGLNINEVNNLVQSAFAGGAAGVVFEGERRFDLVVRLDSLHRSGIEDLRMLYIPLENGEQVPLKEVADITYQPGPMQISRDNTARRVYVGINVRGRDIASLVAEIENRLEAELNLPPGYYVEYGGAFENLERASERLNIVVPIALALIIMLILFTLRSVIQTIIITVAIPFAAIGGVLSLVVRDMPFSISAGIGFVVLFGVAVLNGLVLISGLNELKSEGDNLSQRILDGSRRRIRPILLTASTDILGFLPMALSSSAGAEVQRPLATVVIGGLLTSGLLTLIVLPILYQWVERRGTAHGPRRFKFLSTTAVCGFALLLGGTSMLHAQDPDSLQIISLQQFLSESAERSPRRKATGLLVEQERQLHGTIWRFGRTELTTGSEEMTASDPGTRTLLRIKQSDIDLLGLIPRNDMASERLISAQIRMDLEIRQQRYAWQLLYAEAVAAREIWHVRRRSDSLYRQLTEAVKLRVQTGDRAPLDSLAIATQAGEERTEHLRARDRYLSMLERLRILTGRDTLFRIDARTFERWDNDPSVLYGNMDEHPLVRLARQRIEEKRAERNLAVSRLFPTFHIGYAWQRIGGRDDFHAWEAGISIPLPLLAEQQQVRAADIRIDVAKQAMDVVRQELSLTIAEAEATYARARYSWEFYLKEALPAARERKRAAILSYREGDIDLMTLLFHMNATLRAELAGWEARLAYIRSMLALAYYQNNVKG